MTGIRMELQPVRMFLLLTSALCLGVVAPAFAQDTAGTVVLNEVTVSGGTGTGYVGRRNVAATKTETPLRETAAAVSVVTAEVIEDQAVTSVAQALRYTAGVSSEYRGASNMSDEAYLRGFGYAPRYVDGLLINGQSQQIDPWMLESIAVIKGPASMFYGQSSPGGLIDTVTKRANGSTVNRIGFSTGSHSRAETRFDFARPIAGTNLSWRIVGLAAQHDTQENGLTVRRVALAPSLHWQISDQTQLTLTANYKREPYAGYRNFRTALGTLTPTSHGFIPYDMLAGDPSIERSDRTSRSLGYSFEHRFSDDLVLRHKVRAGTSDWHLKTLVWDRIDPAADHLIERSFTNTYENKRQAAADTHIEYRFNTGAAQHRLVAGFDVQYTNTLNRQTSGVAAPPLDWTNPVYGNLIEPPTAIPAGNTVRVRQMGVYLQDQVTFGGLHLQGGLRYDRATNLTTNNTNGRTTQFDSKALTGRVGALYDWGNGLSTYASYSTSFEPVTTVPVAGQAPFKPTEGRQFEIGAKWANADDTLLVTAALYDLRQTNVLKAIAGSNPARSEQVGEIRSRGFELEAQGRIAERFSLIGAYAYNDSRISKSTIAAEIGRRNDRIPMHQLSLWGKYEFDNGFDAALGIRYMGKSFDRSNTVTVPGVTLLDVAFGYDLGRRDSRFEGLRAQLNVSNLTDKFYTASCASTVACFVGNGRSVTASIDYRW